MQIDLKQAASFIIAPNMRLCESLQRVGLAIK